MAGRREVIGGRAMTEAHLFDHAEAFQLIEISVDRREMDVRGAALHLGRELLGRAVPTRFEERLDEEAPRRRDPVPPGVQEIEHLFEVLRLQYLAGAERSFLGHRPSIGRLLVALTTLLRATLSCKSFAVDRS